jgi:hypothetical protein
MIKDASIPNVLWEISSMNTSVVFSRFRASNFTRLGPFCGHGTQITKILKQIVSSICISKLGALPLNQLAGFI